MKRVWPEDNTYARSKPVGEEKTDSCKVDEELEEKRN
jgi:hypothetical protein